jgi:hypothetical protein
MPAASVREHSLRMMVPSVQELHRSSNRLVFQTVAGTPRTIGLASTTGTASSTVPSLITAQFRCLPALPVSVDGRWGGEASPERMRFSADGPLPVAVEAVQHGAVAGAGIANLGQAAGRLLLSIFWRVKVSSHRGDGWAPG